MKRVWERWKGYVADEGAFNMCCTELLVNMCRDVLREESKLSSQKYSSECFQL